MSKKRFLQLLKSIVAWWKNRVAWLKNKMDSLTLYEKLSLVISFFGALSLIFIYSQTRLIYVQTGQATVNMQASIYATIANQTLELDKIFIEKPELRPFFYDGVDIKENEKNYNQVMAIAEYHLDFFDSTMTQLGYIPEEQDSKENKETWNHYFADGFAKSPALCKRIRSNSNWYMRPLVQIACENCK